MAVGITERWFSIIFQFKAAPQALVGTSCATAKINSCKAGIPRHLPETQCLATTEPCPVGLWFFPLFYLLPTGIMNYYWIITTFLFTWSSGIARCSWNPGAATGAFPAHCSSCCECHVEAIAGPKQSSSMSKTHRPSTSSMLTDGAGY